MVLNEAQNIPAELISQMNMGMDQMQNPQAGTYDAFKNNNK